MYDVTPFLEDHPGGAEILLLYGGKDATADFNAIGHSDMAKGYMKTYLLADGFTLGWLSPRASAFCKLLRDAKETD